MSTSTVRTAGTPRSSTTGTRTTCTTATCTIRTATTSTSTSSRLGAEPVGMYAGARLRRAWGGPPARSGVRARAGAARRPYGLPGRRSPAPSARGPLRQPRPAGDGLAPRPAPVVADIGAAPRRGSGAVLHRVTKGEALRPLCDAPCDLHVGEVTDPSRGSGRWGALLSRSRVSPSSAPAVRRGCRARHRTLPAPACACRRRGGWSPPRH
jgi:hypothetical protein